MAHTFKMELGSHPWMWCHICSYISENLNFRDYIKLKNTTSIFFFFFGHALQHADGGVPHEVEGLNLNHWTTRKDPNHSQNKICKLPASCKHSFKVPSSSTCNYVTILTSNQFFLKEAPLFLANSNPNS